MNERGASSDCPVKKRDQIELPSAHRRPSKPTSETLPLEFLRSKLVFDNLVLAPRSVDLVEEREERGQGQHRDFGDQEAHECVAIELSLSWGLGMGNKNIER